MKYYKYVVIILLCMTSFSSCLKKGLPKLENWDLNNIENIYVEHRYESDKVMNGRPVVAYQRLNVVRSVDESNGVIDLKIEVPQASGLSLKRLEIKCFKLIFGCIWIFLQRLR